LEEIVDKDHVFGWQTLYKIQCYFFNISGNFCLYLVAMVCLPTATRECCRLYVDKLNRKDYIYTIDNIGDEMLYILTYLIVYILVESHALMPDGYDMGGGFVQELSELDFGSFMGAPLIACIEAQVRIRYDFITFHIFEFVSSKSIYCQ
jgi:hypothetical protein